MTKTRTIVPIEIEHPQWLTAGLDMAGRAALTTGRNHQPAIKRPLSTGEPSFLSHVRPRQAANCNTDGGPIGICHRDFFGFNSAGRAHVCGSAPGSAIMTTTPNATANAASPRTSPAPPGPTRHPHPTTPAKTAAALARRYCSGRKGTTIISTLLRS